MKKWFTQGPAPRVIGLILSLFSLAGSSIAAPSLSGTSVAVLEQDGPRAGKWKYSIQANWVSDLPTWQFTLDLGLASCPCVCAGVFDTEFPAGSGVGNGGTCTSVFNGKFSCGGDPFVNLSTPALDWWPMSSGCRPHGVGTGTLVFYSDLRPRTVPSTATLYARSGTAVWTGQVTGQLPSCVGCTQVSVEGDSWGRIKAVYR